VDSRGCGGIYCENCCAGTAVIHGENVHVCIGCSRGETPGEAIKTMAVHLSESATELVGEQATMFPLQMGALYGSESPSPRSRAATSPSSPKSPTAASSSGAAHLSNKSDANEATDTSSGAVPSCGYFELANKTDQFISAKIFIGSNWINELSRPSFSAVAPQSLVSGEFDATAPELTLVLLVDNPNEMTAQSAKGGGILFVCNRIL
jgi:hypothetical protein